MVNILKLSHGMMRIYIVLAVITFIASLWYTWADVTSAEKWKAELVSGIRITAVTTGYTLLSGGTQKFVEHPPMNTTMTYGWATYLCLNQIGHVYFVDEKRDVHTHMPAKEFIQITNSDNFKKCLVKTIDDARSKVLQAKLISLGSALMAVILLYPLLLLITHTVAWIVRGFRKDK